MATLVPPQFGAVTTDTTAQTLASLNPVVNPPAPVAPPALTGPYPSTGAAQAAASPINPVKLDYVSWAVATIQSYPGTSLAELAAETSQTAYKGYVQVWTIMQQMRQQPGVAAQYDAMLGAMAAS